MKTRARAITFEEFKKNGGGGPDQDDEGALAPLWRYWAKKLVSARVASLEALASHTPQQHVDLNTLRGEFERVCASTGDACSAIRKYSPYYPYVKHFM